MSFLIYLAGSAVMFILVLVLAYAVSRTRTRTSDRLGGPLYRAGEGESPVDRLVEVAVESPLGWSIVFLALVLVSVSSIILYFSDVVTVLGSGLTVITVLFGVTLLIYLLYGVYRVARSHGHSSALSITESLVFLGLLGIIGVVGHLVFLM